MHAENWYAAAGPPGAAAAPDEDADDGELPPQPAALTMTATAAKSTRPREGRGQMGSVGVIVRRPLRASGYGVSCRDEVVTPRSRSL
jgi:hypothetical protein